MLRDLLRSEGPGFGKLSDQIVRVDPSHQLMKDRKVTHIRRSLHTAAYVDGPRQQVLFSFRDLGGMYGKWSRQLHTASCR